MLFVISVLNKGFMCNVCECVIKPTEDGAHDGTNTYKKLRSGGDVRLGYAQSCMIVGVVGKVFESLHG